MPRPELFLVELRTRDRAALAAWYADALGMGVLLDDPAGDFSLLAAGRTRLAIQGGRDEPASGSVLLMFLVDDVDAERTGLRARGVAVSAPEDSPEGYRAVRLADPAGHPIRLFQWVGPPPAGI